MRAHTDREEKLCENDSVVESRKIWSGRRPLCRR